MTGNQDKLEEARHAAKGQNKESNPGHCVEDTASVQGQHAGNLSYWDPVYFF